MFVIREEVKPADSSMTKRPDQPREAIPAVPIREALDHPCSEDR